MSNLSVFLQDVAQKCRFWSRTTFDLTTAGNLRSAAEELEDKAKVCGDIDCPDKNESPRKAGPRREQAHQSTIEN
jgi:hypothetical protein